MVLSVRSNAVAQLLEGIRNERGAECLAVVGGARVGKTTLLRTVGNGLGETEVVLAYDGNALRSLTEIEIAAKLTDEIDGALAVARVAGKRVAVLIDDFDVLVPLLPIPSLHVLREKFQQADCGLVITSREYLSALAKRAGVISRFEGIFAASILCGPLTDAESLRLIADALPGRLNAAWLSTWVLGTAGPHPFFLESLLDKIVRRAQKGMELTDEVLEQVRTVCVEAWERPCAELWSTLTPSEAELLLRISNGDQPQDGSAETRRLSRSRGVVVARDGKWGPINPIVGAWVTSNRESVSFPPSGAVRRASLEIERTFQEADRDPDPLYYLRRALQHIESQPQDYDSANAMLRTTMENFLMVAGERVEAGSYEGLRGGTNLRKQAIGRIVRSCALDEAFVNYWNELLSYLNKNGSHPGSPGEAEDTRLRLNVVCDVMTLISVRLRVGVASDGKVITA
jgi:hypothetical protein